MLGEKIKALRETKGLVQREVATELGVDIAYISKMEHGEKPVSRNHLEKLSRLFEVPEEELLTLWVADKLYAIAKDEEVALQAIEVVQDELKYYSTYKKKL
ncbi:MAG: helix-turn-helix transcriptional regulator [Bacteroidetes bacterium]|nr:helix-turn-helix transcriptional regulator [Bacteroidota bacterium]